MNYTKKNALKEIQDKINIADKIAKECSLRYIRTNNREDKQNAKRFQIELDTLVDCYNLVNSIQSIE